MPPERLFRWQEAKLRLLSLLVNQRALSLCIPFPDIGLRCFIVVPCTGLCLETARSSRERTGSNLQFIPENSNEPGLGLV
jgi:hypothetical protein